MRPKCSIRIFSRLSALQFCKEIKDLSLDVKNIVKKSISGQTGGFQKPEVVQVSKNESRGLSLLV